jgi:hypothetical protein
VHKEPKEKRMGTFTAQMLIGHAHPNHDGIDPTHVAMLSENSRPSWTLREWEGERAPRVVWIPTLEHMLEDGLLLACLRVVRAPDLVAEADAKLMGERAELHKVDQARLSALRAGCRPLEGFKVVLTVLDGSTLSQQLKTLDEYRMDVEVFFTRSWSRWLEETRITGSLGE